MALLLWVPENFAATCGVRVVASKHKKVIRKAVKVFQVNGSDGIVFRKLCRNPLSPAANSACHMTIRNDWMSSGQDEIC